MTVDLADPPVRTPRRSTTMTTKAKAWIATAAAVTAAAGAAGLVGIHLLTTDEFPAGTHPVAVYTVVDEFTTSGANGNHLLGMCSTDSYYVKVDSAELCVVLNGSLGTVQAEGTENGIVLDAAAVRAVQDMVRQADAGGPDRTTQVLLQHEGSLVAAVSAVSLQAGGAVTATSID